MTDYSLTDAEWREFQSIPDQGNLHRHWVNCAIARRLDALRAQLDEMTAETRRVSLGEREFPVGIKRRGVYRTRVDQRLVGPWVEVAD